MFERLIHWTFTREGTTPTRPVAVFLWSEKRRPVYNLIVGLTGILTCSTFLMIGSITNKLIGEPIGIPDPPIVAVIGILFYALAAKIGYCVGPVAEIIVAHCWRERAGSFGEIAFFLGTIASILITLLPAFLIIVVAVISVLLKLHRG